MTKQEFLSISAPNEDVFTAQTHRYINNNYPALRGFYMHIANESATNVQIRQKLIAMGLLAGAPDFLFLKPYTWFLELKMPYGVISPKQKALHEKWKSEGIVVEVAYNKTDVIEIIEKHISL